MRKTKKDGAADCSVSSNELNSTTKEQVSTIHEEETEMNEKEINTVKELDENTNKSRLISSTMNLYGDKDAETLFAADRQFVSSLLAEITFMGSDNQDEYWLKEKNQFYEETFTKLKQANPEELYEDVCAILDISHDFVPTDYKSNSTVHFQNKISDIIEKYNLSEHKIKDSIQHNKSLMLLIDKNNLSEQ